MLVVKASTKIRKVTVFWCLILALVLSIVHQVFAQIVCHHSLLTKLEVSVFAYPISSSVIKIVVLHALSSVKPAQLQKLNLQMTNSVLRASQATNSMKLEVHALVLRQTLYLKVKVV